MQCGGGGDNPQRDNNVSSSSRCNCVQRVQEALLRCCRGVVGCQRSSQQSEAYLFSVSNPLHSTDEVRMVSHPQKHRFRNGIPWNWLHVARRFTGLLTYSCGVLFRSFIYGLDVGFFIGQCWWRKNRARRWSSEQREWCAGELEESRKADKARRVLETLMSLFDFWLFLSIRNWNMEYKFELLKTVLIGWFWLRGHIIRPPLIQDPMRKFLCWNITEDPGSSISGGGGVYSLFWKICPLVRFWLSFPVRIPLPINSVFVLLPLLLGWTTAPCYKWSSDSCYSLFLWIVILSNRMVREHLLCLGSITHVRCERETFLLSSTL